MKGAEMKKYTFTVVRGDGKEAKESTIDVLAESLRQAKMDIGQLAEIDGFIVIRSPEEKSNDG